MSFRSAIRTDPQYWNRLVRIETGIECPVDWEYWVGDKNIELGMPWLTPGSIIRLHYLLEKDFNVVEFGCGGSTIFFGNHCQSVSSFETNPEYYERVKEALHQRQLNHVSLSLLASHEEHMRAIENIPNQSVDCMLIDNGMDATMGRGEIGKLLLPKLKFGGLVVIDNFFIPDMIFELTLPGWIQEDFNDMHWHGSGTRIAFQR